MNYYSVSFGYAGPKGMGNHDEPQPMDKALSRAERHVEAVLKQHGFDVRHSYCWPDGSLYKYVRTLLSMGALAFELEKLFEPNSDLVWVEGIGKVNPKTDPYKAGVETVEEYFNLDRKDGVE